MGFFSKEKEEDKELDPYVEVSYGAFSFKGDVRMILPTMKEVKGCVMPLMEEGNRQAVAMGLVSPQINVKHGEGDNRGYD